MRNLEGKMAFQSRFREVNELLKDATRDGIQTFAERVAKRAKEIVPVKSGRLRDSIKASVRKARKEERIIATVSSNTKGMPLFKKDLVALRKGSKKKRDVETTVKYGYGLDVEIGRIGRKYKKTPYLRPALDQTKPYMADILRGAAAKASLKQSKRKAA